MKMTKYFICCEKCYRDLNDYNPASGSLWMAFCKDVLESGSTFIEFYDCYISSLRTLEEKGFIVSTDRKDRLLVHVKGYMTTENGEHFFCAKEGCHE